MKILIENHPLKNKNIRYKKTNEILTIEDVYNVSFIGNTYISLLVNNSDLGKVRTNTFIDWELIELAENCDLGKNWQEHIKQNNEDYELIEDL